jgi:hypothetical protein
MDDHWLVKLAGSAITFLAATALWLLMMLLLLEAGTALTREARYELKPMLQDQDAAAPYAQRVSLQSGRKSR